MQREVYELENSLEKNHWWFVSRRQLFSKYIFDLGVPKDAAVLDIGSSSGTNLRLLKSLEFSNYKGFDMSALSKRLCEDKGLGEVILGDICSSKLKSNSYDLILATDILEHIDDDVLALREIDRLLKPGGIAIITVPTFMCIWGLQDVVSMHKRRYLLSEINNRIQGVGLDIQDSYYFNFLLFIPIYIARKIIRLLSLNLKSENQINSKYLNIVLKVIFSIDIYLSRKIKKIPFGVSAFILARKV